MQCQPRYIVHAIFIILLILSIILTILYIHYYKSYLSELAIFSLALSFLAYVIKNNIPIYKNNTKVTPV